MCPGADFQWITAPDGADVRRLFASEGRPIRIYHPQMLYGWGLQLMERALQIRNPINRAVRYRNGLLIAVLATRAPRLRSLAAIRIGVQVVRHDDRFQPAQRVDHRARAGAADHRTKPVERRAAAA